MKKAVILIAATLLTTAGCATKLNEQDRALLEETHTMAMEAQNQSTIAAQNAARSAQAAEAAAGAANIASMRATRVFETTARK